VKLYSFKQTPVGMYYPDAYIWVTEGTEPGISEPEMMVAGIRIPIPWPFAYYQPHIDEAWYGYWYLNLALRLDHKPTLRGNLPDVRFARFYTWRKPVSQHIMKTMNQWRSGPGRS